MTRGLSSLDHDDVPEDWHHDVRRSTTMSQTKLGVPYFVFVGNFAFNLLIVSINFGWPYIGIPFFCIIHFGARAWGEHDPQWFEVILQSHQTWGDRLRRHGFRKFSDLKDV